MEISRRKALMSALFGAGYVGLRALATGIPAGVLLRARDGLAADACSDAAKAQFIIFNTSAAGDPINANAPGSYDDPGITHPADPEMAATPLVLGGRQTVAARPWSLLPQSVLDRTSFWHIMTNTPVHPDEPDVLRLRGRAAADEMLPSILAKQLAPCLGTVQIQPITLGATSPSESLSFAGRALPIIPPLALRATLTAPGGALANLATLQSLRDQTLGQLDALYRTGATPSQARYLDALIQSQGELRNIRSDLLATLGAIADNSITSQIAAAVALIQMNVTPVIAIHIPFGGDNHSDPGLANEARQTISGVAAIGDLMARLAAAGLSDRVSFLSLNVFGRTLGARNVNGRDHNQNHQVSIAIGKPFRGGIIGAVAPVDGDYGALSIDAATGAGSPTGNVRSADTLASFARTALAAVGTDPAVIASSVTAGTVIGPALA